MEWESTEDNGEGPSKTSRFYMDRKHSTTSAETSTSEEQPVTSIAQSALVIRRGTNTPMNNGEGPSGGRMGRKTLRVKRISINNPAHSYPGQLVVPSPFGRPIEPVIDTTMDKGKGKAPMMSVGAQLEDLSTSALETEEREAVELVESVTEAMNTLVFNERKRPGPTPIQMVDWSRLTNPAYVGQRGSESTIRKLIEFPTWG
jgi:hypothetical protein